MLLLRFFCVFLFSFFLVCFFALDLKPIHKAQAAKIDYLHLRPLMTLWQQSTDVLIHIKMMKCRLAFALDILFSAEI